MLDESLLGPVHALFDPLVRVGLEPLCLPPVDVPVEAVLGVPSAVAFDQTLDLLLDALFATKSLRFS
jgi:hypothetical protein